METTCLEPADSSSFVETLTSHRVGSSRHVLSAALEQDVDLVIWQRALPDHVVTALERWEDPCEVSVDVQPSTAHERARELLTTVDSRRGISHPPHPQQDSARPRFAEATPRTPIAALDWLSDDMSRLLARFGELADGHSVRASLSVQRQPACRLLHVDYHRLRLICTYAGPGTEWVPRERVVWSALGTRHPTLAAANAAICPDRSAIVCAGAGDVLVMKGLGHPASAGRAAVHRSPETDGARVVLIATAEA